MRLTFSLFLLELKRTVKFLPRLVLFAALIFAFLFSVIYIGEKRGEKPDTRVKIGYFAFDENDVYIPMLVNMVNEMDSVKSICVLESADSEQQVYDGIKSGKYYGGVIFPQNYVQNIMSGIDDPARVIVPKGSNNAVFRRLVKIGSDMLISVQAGIYSTADGKKLTRSELLSINLEYVNFVLGRNSLFKKENWSAYGVFSFAQYYCVMFLSLLSVLIGAGLSFLFYDYGSGFKSYCKLWQYNGVIMLLLKQLLVFVITAAVIVPSLIFIDKNLPFVEQDYLMIIAALFISSQLTACFYTVFGGNAVMLITVFGIVTGFLSGCFIPLVYLGGTGLDKLCVFMPVYTVSECYATLYTYNAENVNILPMSAAIYAVTFAVCAVKRKFEQ